MRLPWPSSRSALSGSTSSSGSSRSAGITTGHARACIFKSALEVENGLWLFRAAPVFQEIFGGKDDGKTVWTGFEFHTTS